MKISLALGLATLGFVFARNCKPCENGNHMRNRDSSSSSSSSRSDSRSSSDSSDSKIRRRGGRKCRRVIRDDCSSSSSSSSDSCSRSDSRSCDRPIRLCRPCPPVPPTPPTPVPRCEQILIDLIAGLDATLLSILRSIITRYNLELDGLFTQLNVLVETLNPTFLGIDYGALITQLNALVGGVIPGDVAGELLAVQTALIADLLSLIQTIILGSIANLEGRLDGLCINEIIDLISTGLLQDQIQAALAAATGAIAAPIQAALAEQLQIILNLGLPEIVATADAALLLNMQNLSTYFTGVLNTLLADMNALLASTLTQLTTIVTDGVSEFQNAGIQGLNNIAIALFGPTVTPIPPVVFVMMQASASSVDAVKAKLARNSKLTEQKISSPLGNRQTSAVPVKASRGKGRW